MTLEVRSVTKRYGETTALQDVSLQTRPQETLAILGPSGCGKSTLLRVIAGLERPDSGAVLWDGVDITAVSPHLRHFGLMFQGYALFPHRTVRQNVDFGLRMQGVPTPERTARVRQALEWVDMTEFADRSVEGLSGGEQQRVALARTLAPGPRLVMLDEPLGALDRRLRERLVVEIDELLRRQGSAALYVTHDHEEAAAVGDRIILMRGGRIVQIGTLEELEDHPADDWVAEFLG